MAELEKYLRYDGQELQTPSGGVLTVADVAGEALKHATGTMPVTMDSQGRVVFATEGAYKWAIDPSQIMNSEVYATKNSSDIEGPRKINGVEMWADPSKPGAIDNKSQIRNIENGYNPETGKSGQVRPMIYLDKEDNRTYVSVQSVNRFGNMVTEVDRRDYNRPEEELTKMKAEGRYVTVNLSNEDLGLTQEGIEGDNLRKTLLSHEATLVIEEDGRKYHIIKLSEKDLGLGMSNDARVTAPGGRLALLSREATLVVGDGVKPSIENGVWQPYERFITENIEDMGRDAVMTVRELYNLPVDAELLKIYKADLPSYVQEQLAKEMAK